MSQFDVVPSLIIIVRNAQKSDDLLSHHITYEIASVSTSSALTIVRRRYKDFEWLHGALAARYPGCIVPVLPEKRNDNVLFGFDLEFVEERRKALQTFVFNVCCHPALSHAPEILSFCTSPSPQLYSTEEVHHTLGTISPSLSASLLAKAQVRTSSPPKPPKL
jgi:sorting nexin-4